VKTPNMIYTRYATETPLRIPVGRQSRRRTVSNRLRTASLTFRQRTALKQYLLRSERHFLQMSIYLRAHRKHRSSCLSRQARVSYSFFWASVNVMKTQY